MRIRNALAALLATLLVPAAASAQRVGPRNACVDLGDVIDAQTMESSRSFSVDRDTIGGWGALSVYISLTDANTSITRFDLDCTASYDGNVTDFTLQSCAVATGVCTSSDATWQKASPGSTNWVWRVDVEGYEDVECTVSVGAGTGAAADVVTVHGRLCVKGGS